MLVLYSYPLLETQQKVEQSMQLGAAKKWTLGAAGVRYTAPVNQMVVGGPCSVNIHKAVRQLQ